jgi:hypothetical protein
MMTQGCALSVARRDCQEGVALITAAIFLLIISLLSIASLRSGTQGVRMAQNEEARFSAVQAAQALTEAIVADPAATPVIGDGGFTNCTAAEVGCDLNNIVPPVGWVADQVAAGHLRGRVVLTAPSDRPPPRVVESSLDKFSAASFEVTANFDRSQEGLGSVELVEGLLVLVPRN